MRVGKAVHPVGVPARLSFAGGKQVDISLSIQNCGSGEKREVNDSLPLEGIVRRLRSSMM